MFSCKEMFVFVNKYCRFFFPLHVDDSPSMFFTKFGKMSFSYLISTVWNTLSIDVRLLLTTDTFKRARGWWSAGILCVQRTLGFLHSLSIHQPFTLNLMQLLTLCPFLVFLLMLLVLLLLFFM